MPWPETNSSDGVVRLGVAQFAERINDVRRDRLAALTTVDQHSADDMAMRRSEPGHHGLGKRLGVGASNTKIAAFRRLAVEFGADLAQTRIFVDTDGKNVQRAALVERAIAVMGDGNVRGGVAGFVDGDDADDVAALARAVRGIAARRLGWRLGHLNAVDLNADQFDRVGRGLKREFELRIAAGQSGIGGGGDDAEARHGLLQQIAELEVRAGRLLHGFFGAGELDGLGDDVRAVEIGAELGGGDVVGGACPGRD